MEVLLSLRQPRSTPRIRRLRDAFELPQDGLHLLLDDGRGGGRLVPLETGQSPLAVLVGEIELREPYRDDRRADERHDDSRVLPDQASVRPCGGFQAVLL